MQPEKKSNYHIILMMMQLEAYVFAPFMMLYLYFYVKTGIFIAAITGVMLFASAHGAMFYIRQHPERFAGAPRENPSKEQQSEEL